VLAPRALLHRVMTLERRMLQRVDEVVLTRVGAIVTVHAADHVLHRVLERRRAGLGSAFATTHAVSDHRDERHPLVAER